MSIILLEKVFISYVITTNNYTTTELEHTTKSFLKLRTVVI